VIVHLVMFRFKPGVSRQDARVVAVAKAMEDLPKQIPVIRSWHHGFNMSEDVLAWDYGLQAVFNSEADLQTYFEHPAHLPVLELWDEIATLGFTDFVV
jgi:Stress responsive A/B Barrel Domain